MKRFIWFVLVVFAFSSCEKYRLSQPAYLNFGWKYVNQDDSCRAQITGMEFYLTNFSVSGIRKEGEPIEMTKDFSDDLVSFNGEGVLGIGMDVPVGQYTTFNLTMNVPKKNPSLVLKGTFKKDGETFPLRIEWTDSKSLVFKALSEFELKKKKTYNVTLNLDLTKLFEDISENKWGTVSPTNENGTSMVIISSANYPLIFSNIDSSIADAIYLTVP